MSSIKLIHQVLVALSLAGFALRWSASLAGAQWTRGRFARSAPHLVDSLLLASGLWLAWMWGAALGPWFVAKMAGLLLYILLGWLALRPGLHLRARLLAGAAALLVVGWMVSVAVLKHPAGLLAFR